MALAAARLPTRSGTEVLPRYAFAVGGAEVRLYQDDCLVVLPALQAASLDVVVTSPPYNLGIRYRSYKDDLPRAEYLSWTDRWIRAIARVMAPQGSFFLNVGAKPSDPWIPLEVAQVARRYFKLQNTIHWVKSIAIDRGNAGALTGLDRDVAVGHYKPINSDRFVNDCHEFVFHFTPEGRTPLERRAIGVRYQDASNIGRWRAAAGNRRCRGNTWFIPYQTIQDRDKDRPHPATFPPRIPEYCVKLHGLNRVKLMLDPFLGLGNSAIAALHLGVSFAGIEIDRHYLTEAVSRVKAALD
jgi:site-specific DNA-methyltransferase (adenine-specific)